MNISFTEKQKEYIRNLIETGDFQNSSEVVRDALRLHKTYRHKVIEELRAEIEKGWDSGNSNRTISDILSDKAERS